MLLLVLNKLSIIYIFLCLKYASFIFCFKLKCKIYYAAWTALIEGKSVKNYIFCRIYWENASFSKFRSRRENLYRAVISFCAFSFVHIRKIWIKSCRLSSVASSNDKNSSLRFFFKFPFIYSLNIRLQSQIIQKWNSE